MSTRARRLLARYRRVLSALLAAVAVLVIIETIAPSAPASRRVVVAARDLPSGAVLTAADLDAVPMPPSVVPSGSASSASELLGRVVAGPMRAREVVTDQRLLGRSLLAGYPTGSVATPVRIRDPGVVALLQVGGRIDVYAARSDTTAADLVVGDAVVVALPKVDDDGQQGGLVVLCVTPAQAAALAEASATAPLSVTMLR